MHPFQESVKVARSSALLIPWLTLDEDLNECSGIRTMADLGGIAATPNSVLEIRRSQGRDPVFGVILGVQGA
jgi:hypothetical protein